MIGHFEKVMFQLLQRGILGDFFSQFYLEDAFNPVNGHSDVTPAEAMTWAFLVSLAGRFHDKTDQALDYLKKMSDDSRWSDTADFYMSARDRIRNEIIAVCREYPDVADRLKSLCLWLSDPKNVNSEDTRENIWSFFFPEATGIFGARKERIAQLRARRRVNVTTLNPSPVTDPGRQILFTSNVLLTVPAEPENTENLPLSSDLKRRIRQCAHESQRYWYDHPIQIGVMPEKNEVFHGLRKLNEAMLFERERGNLNNEKVKCLLSVSVTHKGLQKSAKQYLEEELARGHDLSELDVYVFTEADTEAIVDEILVPAAAHYMNRRDAKTVLDFFGVDGEYGRHYSFLKAISVFWNVLIDTEIKATFKIDLDQAFPQEALVEQTGASAFEHFMTPLWGACGLDSNNREIELGMIAGALVNERDIACGLFTPDVTFPDAVSSSEERIFFSALPQALSTEAEMMTRYAPGEINGRQTCIQRIHVTGGTNGILVNSLRRHRPFTPSFIGRAEDQAYILSTMGGKGPQLAYVHKDGLIMRHDKEAFAQDAIASATPGKIVGDYVRTLLFSEYGKAISLDIRKVKQMVDPFTGCFISMVPVTVVLIRFFLKALALYASKHHDQADEFILMGVPRMRDALEFVYGRESQLKKSYEKERDGWGLYYDILDAIEKGLKENDGFSQALREKAENIIKGCLMIQG